MSTRDGIADWISRNAEAVRGDARRALHELVSRGDLSADEAEALERAIEDALSRSASFVSENVFAPLRSLLDTVAAPLAAAVSPEDVPDLHARLDALDARLANIERRLAEREPGTSD